MRLNHTALRLASLPLAGLVLTGAAPDETKPDGELHSTRILAAQDEEGPTRTVEREFTIRLEPLPKTSHCQATLAVQYLQYDTIARVKGTIENADCAASGGDYTIAIKIRDENGELKTLKFDESWQRDDDQPVNFRAEYPIGENVDIVGVRPSRLRCTCAEAPGE